MKHLKNAKHTDEAHQNKITKEDLERALPPVAQKLLTQGSINRLNLLLEDEELQHGFREDIIGLCSIMDNPHYKLNDYINAVRFSTYKRMGDSDITAYSKVFPDRYKQHTAPGVAKSRIHTYVNAYKSTKLVQDVITVAALPTHIMYRDAFHEAVMTQVEIMRTAKSDKVRSDAANSVLTHTKPPQESKHSLELNVSHKGDKDMITQLREHTEALRAAQKEKIISEQSGNSGLREIAAGRIVDAEIIEDDD